MTSFTPPPRKVHSDRGIAKLCSGNQDDENLNVADQEKGVNALKMQEEPGKTDIDTYYIYVTCKRSIGIDLDIIK